MGNVKEVTASRELDSKPNAQGKEADGSSAQPRRRTRLIIVGAGPCGLTLALVVARYGVDVVILEKRRGPNSEPRAVSLDDDTLRLFADLNVLPLFEESIMPGTGTLYLDRHERPLLRTRGNERLPNGHFAKNHFGQPQLETALVKVLQELPNVDLRFGAEAFEIDEGREDGKPSVVIEEPNNSDRVEVADWIVGCDGAHSFVRKSLQIGLEGSAFSERWLVVDVLNDPHDERFAIHIGDPVRPRVIVPGKDGRCRYEFLLHDGEVADGSESTGAIEIAQRLVAPYRVLERHEIDRWATYSFQARVASTWKKGNYLLAGDAAHLMPPYAGQGLNTGLRDVANLGWRLGLVLGAGADAGLLDNYEVERKSKALSAVRLSVALAHSVMTQRRPQAAVRDALVRAAIRVPALRRYLKEMRYRPSSNCDGGFKAPGCTARRCLVGSVLPSVEVMDTANRVLRLDDLVCTGFVLAYVAGPRLSREVANGVACGVDGPISIAELVLDDRQPQGMGDVLSVSVTREADCDRLRPHAGRWILVRPDKVVSACLSSLDDLDQESDEAVIVASLRSIDGKPFGARMGVVREVSGV